MIAHSYTGRLARIRAAAGFIAGTARKVGNLFPPPLARQE